MFKFCSTVCYLYTLRQICLASKPLFLPLQNGNEQYSLFTVVWRFSETKYVKAFSSLLPNANSVPNFSSTFLRRIMPVFHFSPFCPLIPPPLHSWLFSLFLFLFFLADLVSLASPSMDVCFDRVYFSIMNFPWVPFSFAFLQASFVLPGALVRCTLMSTLAADFGLHWGKEGGSCVETAFTGPRGWSG